MEAGNNKLTRGTCFLACRLELNAVAWLLWISWCVSGGMVYFVCIFLSIFFSSNAHGLLQVLGIIWLITLSTSNETRSRERSDRGYFCLYQKKPLHTGVRTGCHYLICRLSVCACVPLVIFNDCESYTRPISTNPGSMEAGNIKITRGTCFLACRLVLDAVAGLL